MEIPQKTIEALGLEETEHTGFIQAILFGSKVWNTKEKDIYLSDYDFFNHRDLKQLGLYTLIHPKKCQSMVSAELLKDEKASEIFFKDFVIKTKLT